jgi:hypothetical protein
MNKHISDSVCYKAEQINIPMNVVLSVDMYTYVYTYIFVCKHICIHVENVENVKGMI